MQAVDTSNHVSVGAGFLDQDFDIMLILGC